MIERILKLIKENGITAKKLTDELELSNSAITDWKKGKAKPSTDAIIKIANYFNVSTDYLLIGKTFTNDKMPTQITDETNVSYRSNFTDEDENLLISGFRKLDKRNKGIMLGRLESFLEINYNADINEMKVANPEETYNYAHRNDKIDIKQLPLLGQTISEPPINVIKVGGQNYVEVPKDVDADYALFINDDCMAPKINVRDLVYIKGMPQVEHGTIAVVELCGKIHCKIFQEYDGKVELLSLNRECKTIKVENEVHIMQFTNSLKKSTINGSNKTSFRIIGKVVLCQDHNSNFFAL